MYMQKCLQASRSCRLTLLNCFQDFWQGHFTHLDGLDLKEVELADPLAKVNQDDGKNAGYSPSPYHASKSSHSQQSTEGHTESLRRSGRCRNQAYSLVDLDEEEVRPFGALLNCFRLHLQAALTIIAHAWPCVPCGAPIILSSASLSWGDVCG